MSAVPSRGKRTGRALKVLQWLDTQNKPRLVKDIIQAVEPKCDTSLMYGTLSTLQRGKKLIVKKAGDRNVFSIAPGALINPRTGIRLDQPQPLPVKAARKALAAARREARAQALPHSVARTSRATSSAAPAPTARTKASHSAFLITPNSIHHQVTNAHGGAYMAIKREQSAQISVDIDAFLAKGGEIEKLHVSASSRPLLAAYGEYVEASARKQEREKARQRGGYKKPTKPVDDLDDSEDIEE